MSPIAALKAELDAAIDAALPDGTYDDVTFARIHALIIDLVPHSPTPRPLETQGFVASPWASRFAQFGPRHTAGKPIRHATKLSLQSFNRFPAVEIMVHDIEQEIRVEGAHYNNVAEISTPDGSQRARLIVWGRYSISADAPQRYDVAFYAAELVPPDGTKAEALHTAFGLAPDLELRQLLTPPRLHSDVVYCDDDMRINYGSMGGVYVLRRLHTPGKSVRFG